MTWAASTTSFSLDGDVVVRLLAATVLGSLVGIEREAADQPAGLRTHIAVALGASLFGVISTLGFLEFDQLRANSTVQVDVSRVASNVVVGIGFLGAGVIFRQGGLIRNLTTAASLWTVAAIGLACGVGDITTAAVATVVLLVSLVLLRPLRSLIRQRWATASTRVRVTLADGVDPMAFGDRLPPGEGCRHGAGHDAEAGGPADRHQHRLGAPRRAAPVDGPAGGLRRRRVGGRGVRSARSCPTGPARGSMVVRSLDPGGRPDRKFRSDMETR